MNKKLDLNPTLIGTNGDSLREAFGKALVELADQYPNFVVFDADVAGGQVAHPLPVAHAPAVLLLGRPGVQSVNVACNRRCRTSRHH